MAGSVIEVIRRDDPEPSGQVAFDGRRWPLVLLLLKILLLTVLTLGIYRFWGKTHLRRYFWRHTSILGGRIEYTGRPSELLIGFLLAIAILTPIIMVFSMADALVAGTGGLAEKLNDIIYTLMFIFLGNVALFRMRRYRLSRTVWRGVRCGQGGSAMRYALLASLYWLLVIATLGFAYPWMRTGLNRYLMTNTRFGNQTFEFHGRAGALLAAWLPVFLVVGAMVAALAFLGLDLVVDLVKANATELSRSATIAISRITVLVVVAVPVISILYAHYRVREFRYFVSKTSLAGARFTSMLKTRRILLLVAVFGLLTAAILVLFVAFIWIAFGLGLGAGTSGERTSEIGRLMLPIAILFFVMYGVFRIARIAWLRFGILVEVCRSFHIENEGAIHTITQSSLEGPRYGEGLADVLDLGDF
jgi:uncharacterized membrane protein YjgN (DUF898 family)